MAKTKTDDLPGITGKGVSGIKLPDIDRAVDKYEREKDKRCEMSPKEIAAKRYVLDLLHKHREELPVNEDGARFYRRDGVDYILSEVMKRRSADDGSGADSEPLAEQ